MYDSKEDTTQFMWYETHLLCDDFENVYHHIEDTTWFMWCENDLLGGQTYHHKFTSICSGFNQSNLLFQTDTSIDF